MKNLHHHLHALPLNQHHTFLSPDTQILHLLKNGALSQALNLLNTSQPTLSLKPVIYASLLQTCVKTSSFHHGTSVHAHVLKSGLHSDRFVGNSLLTLYFKLSPGPHLSQARKLFDSLSIKDVISWTSLISGYTRSGLPHQSISLFHQMLTFPIQPNAFTLSSVVKACSQLNNLTLGRCFHSMVITRGFDSNTVVSCSLIDMYGWSRAVEDAQRVFDDLPEKDDVFCWTAIVSTFTRNDMFKEALKLFYVMQRVRGLVPDGFTFGTVLTACANLGLLRQGKEVHAKVVGLGFGGNVVVESSLLDMYGKCGSVRHSRIVFDRLSDDKNSVTWTAMLGVYCQNKEYQNVLDLVRERGVLDFYGFGIVLRACSGLAAVNHGKEVHCKYVRNGGWKDVIIESALVDLYAKCGMVDFARTVFAHMEVRNLITWNSMISGFAQNGNGVEALVLFEDMIKEGIIPDSITFVAVLFACSHAGLVDEGRRFFALMGEYGIKPVVEHYNCMIDLLGRAEFIEEAECLLENADCKYDKSLWAALLGACTKCSDYDTAERIAKKMIELEPNFHLSYVLLGNIYREVGRWDDALEIRKLMEDRGVKKLPGKSWIDSENRKGSHVNACTGKGDSSMREAI
ncbi:unnamed protein product [Lathyrus oleraceus]|uniref:Pentatricopeptide repeat-containing protein n=1 Tax=Pisum sativum TaxID=3888 RepID=A0A9D4YNA4_PEA|nr:pentatricopeptide repeat-containing protein At1g03540 [Pisum sativum]KAI5441010.1 hypothetical protein KIW84_010458 [Pisum sativum]